MGWSIKTENVKQAAGDVSSIGTSVGEMKSYSGESVITNQIFGKIPGVSEQAAAYVGTSKELTGSLGKAEGFVKEYATRLNQAATMTEEADVEAAFGIKNAGNGDS